MKPFFQEVCTIPESLLAPIIDHYKNIDWTDAQYTVKGDAFKNTAGQVKVIITETKIKTIDAFIFHLLDHCFPDKFERIYRVVVANLQAHLTLDWHIDGFEFQFQCWRHQIPIITNPGCRLEIMGNDDVESFSLEVGKAYTFNNNITHRAFNSGDTDRINLIVDVLPDGVPMDIEKLMTHRIDPEWEGWYLNGRKPK